MLAHLQACPIAETGSSECFPLPPFSFLPSASRAHCHFRFQSCFVAPSRRNCHSFPASYSYGNSINGSPQLAIDTPSPTVDPVEQEDYSWHTVLQQRQSEFTDADIKNENSDMRSGQSDTSDEETDEDEQFDQITRISVPKEKYIPVSKVSLVKALSDSFDDEEKASEFLMFCSLLDFILHVEHKAILEQMRIDYKVTRSTLKKEAQRAKMHIGKSKRGLKRNKWLRKIDDFRAAISNLIESNEGLQYINSENGHTVSRDAPSAVKGSSHLSPTLKEQDAAFPSDVSDWMSLDKNNVDEDANRDEPIKKSIGAAARFQRNFLKLLKNAHFQGLSVRDLQLTSALNTDYLLTLPIEVDWRKASSEIAIIFRRGYAAERQEGFLFGAKLDYLQSILLRRIFNWFSRPLFRAGIWINQLRNQWKEKDGSRTWAEEITEWLKEPLKPDVNDDLSGIIADSLTEEEKVDYLPVWLAAQQAVPRYEAFLSSAGSRGVLLRKILVWMRILPSQSVNVPVDLDGISTVEADLRGGNLSRISMRDIWLPASKMVCGTNIWRRVQSAFKVFFSRSTLQEPAYRELVLLYNVPNPDADDIPNLQLKIYEKIPIPDLKVIFPNKKLSFRILDMVRLDIATIIGLLAFLINYRFDDFLSSPSAFLLDIIASSALIVYLSRVVLGYKQTFDRYQLLVNKTLYEKTLASGFGAVHFLVDASEQQEFKESILAFAMLMQDVDKVKTRENLCIKCEQFLTSHFKEQVEMPMVEALKTLSRLGLVIETASGNDGDGDTVQLLPHKKPVDVMRKRWGELLNEKSMSISFLSFLYRNYRTKEN